MTSLRHRLFHGTAVAAALALAPAGLKAAGLLPTGAVIAPLSGPVQAPTGTNVTVGGSGTTLSPYTIAPTAAGAATLNITIGSGAGAAGQFGIINWGGFDIAAGNTVAFAGAGNLSFAVLNRVQGAMSPTMIAGALQGNALGTAGNRGTIFVLNEAGVSFANSATVTNLTGFVASSLDVLDSKFVTLAGTPGSSLEFATSTMLGTGTGTGTGVVHIDADGMTKATISPDSVLLLVAPKLDLQGGALSVQHTEGMTPTAYGDAGVVLASDATVALNPDSIISIKIDKGTAISGSVLNGTVGGQRVLVAAASSTNLMASLLGVGGNLSATTVSATDHGIVIAAGENTAIDGAGHSITFTAAATPAVVGVPGLLTSTGRVDAAATDALTIGAVNATGAASFTSGTALTFAGDVTAGGLMGTGTTITLGADGAAHHLFTTGTLAPLTLTASTGGAAAITTLGNYSVTATGPVVLQQSASVAANVTQDDSLSIAGSSVSLGNVALAATLPTAFGSGNVVLAANGTAATDAVVAGTVAARSGVAASAAGAVTLAGATSGGGVGMAAAPNDVVVTATRTATVSGAVTSTGNYTVTGGDVSLGGAGIAQSAAGDLLVRATTGDLRGSGTLSADSGAAGGHLLVLDATAGRIDAAVLNLSAGTASDVYVNTASDLALGTVDARQFASASLSMMPHSPVRASDYAPTTADTVTIPGAITLGTVTTGQSVTIASTGAVAMHEDVTVGAISSGGAVDVSSANGAVTLAGATSRGVAQDVTVSAAGLATVSGAVTSTGNYTVSGSGVALGGAGIGEAAAGDVVIKSTSTDIGVTGSLAADSGATGGRVLVLDSNAGISGGGSLNAGTASDILLAVNGDVALGAINARQFASTASAAVPLAANYSATIADTLSTGGAITLGVVTTAQATRIASTSVTSGHQDVVLTSDTSSTGAVSLASGNSVTVGSLTSNGGGNVSVTAAGGRATIAGVVNAAGDYVVSGNNVLLGTHGLGVPQAALGSIAVTATGGAIAAADAVALRSNAASGALPTAGTVTLTAATNIGDPASPGFLNVYAGQVTGTIYGGAVTGANSSRRAIILDVTTSGNNGSITLGNVRGATLTGPLGVPLHAGGPVSLGNVDLTGDLNVTSAGALSLTSGLATGNIVLAGTTITLGADGAANALTTAAPLTAATLTASAGGAAAITTLGDFAITAPGAVVLQQSPGTAANVTHDDSLAITGSSVSVGNIALPATPPVLPALVGSGNVALVANGGLATNGVSAGVVAARNAVVARSANGDVTLGGATSGSEGATAHDVSVTAPGHVIVSGAVTSAGNYTVTGLDVTLGGAAPGIVQQAAGNLYVRSGTSIYASGTLVADSDGTGGDRLVLDASSRSIANSAVGPASLRAGPAAGTPTSDILVAVGSGNNLTLGTVAGRSFGTATATTPTPLTVADYAPSGTLILNAAIALGAVTTVTSNTIASTGTLAGQRDVALAGDTSTTGSVTVAANNGAAAITGPVSAHGNYTVIADNVVAGGGGIAQTATGDVLIRATATNVAAGGTLTAGGTLVVDSATSIDGIAGPPAAVAKLVATNDVLLRAGSGAAITLGDISTARLASATSTATPMTVADYTPTLTAGVGTLQSAGAIALGTVATTQSNLITSAGTLQGQRNVTLAGDTSSGGSVEVGSAHGGVSITGLVSAHTSASLHALGAADPLDPTAGTLSVAAVDAFHGDATLAGQNALTVASGSPVAALGNVSLQSNGVISTGPVLAGGTITIAGITPGTGAASLTTTGLAANAGVGVTTVGALDLSTLGLLTPRTQINADLSGFNPANAPYVGNAGIALTSTGSSVRAGAITATGSITLSAATSATVTGNVEAGFSVGSGSYTVSGAQVALGGAGTTQKASGDVWVRSTSGDLDLAGTLIADDGGTGGRRLVLDTAGAIGTISGQPAANLVAGTVAPGLRSDVLIRQANGSNPVTLGSIAANQLASAALAGPPLSVASYTIPVANTLTTSGAISLGAVSTVQATTIASLGTLPGARAVAVGGVTSGGSIVLTSTGGTVTASGPVTAAAGATLTAAGNLTVGDVTAQGGVLTLTGAAIGATSGSHTVSATGAVALQSSGTIALGADAIEGGSISAGGTAGAGSAAGSFAADSLHATGPVTVVSIGDVTLTGANATSVVTSRATPTAADADINLTSQAGTVSINGATTSGSLALTAANLAMVTGSINVGDAMTAGASGNYAVTAGSVSLAGPESATGNIQLVSPGAVQVGMLAAGGAITARGPAAGSGVGSFSGTTLQAGRAISVAAAGMVQLTGSGPARTATERTAFDPVLRTFTLTGRPPAADQALTLTSTGGPVTVVDLASTGNIALNAAGAASVTGVVAAGDGTTAAGDGNYAVQGSTITLGGGIQGQAALGNISLQTPGTITLTALRAGGAITAAGSGPATNAASLTGDSLQANGAITVATTGPLTLAGANTTGVATQRQRIDTNLGGFNGPATANDAGISLTATGSAVPAVSGTISVNGASSTGNIVLAAGTSGATPTRGTIAVTGIFTAGDGQTAGGVGSFTAVAHDLADASAATIDARASIGVTSQTSNALIGTAAAGLNATIGGSVTAQTFGTGASAAIGSGTATLGDVQALATGPVSTASITAANATQGDILADGDAQALVGTGTATGSITAHSQAGTATIDTGLAGGSILASAGTAASIGTGNAIDGSVDALGGTTATVTSGTAGGAAGLGNVRVTSTGGLATITTGSAAQSVVATGGSVNVGQATAGDDIVLIANNGAVSATTLTVTGAATSEAAATDASGAALSFGGNPITGLGGSNVIIRATGAAVVSGTVAISQPVAAKTANYDVTAGSIILGAAGDSLNQSAAGRIDLRATSGDIVLAGIGGALTSDVGGVRTIDALADGTTAGSDLSLTSAGSVTGAPITLIATHTLDAAASAAGQARQPGVTVAAGAGGGGSILLASITGGAVSASAPLAVTIPLVTASGDVAVAGVAATGNDTATINPTTIIIDGISPAAAYGRVDVTAAGGHGAEIAAIGVINGGQIGALQVLSDSGAATLRATPNDPAKITSILVESQTGVAGILNPAGGPASSANPNTVAAQSIVLRGRQTGASVLAIGPLLATGSILATGPSVTIGTAAVTGTVADGPGDLLIAATDAASLAAGIAETAVARRTINVTGGTAVLGDGTATGGTLAVSGTSVTVLRSAVAGDDVVLSSLGPITATGATLRTTGTADLQSGDDGATLGVVSVGMAPGTGYGTGHTVGTDVTTTATDAVTAGNLTRLAGANIVATAGGAIDFGAATMTATAGRDIHVEAGGTVTLTAATAARQFVGVSGGTFTASGTITAGDDLVIGSGAAIDVHTATLATTGGAADAIDARRADGTLLSIPAAGGALTNLGGSNIALAAAGPITLGAITTTAAPSSLRAFSGAAITTTQAISVSGGIALVGTTVTDSFGLTAGDDIVAVARGGTVTLSAPLTTTGMAASSAALADLAGNSIALPGEAALGRVDGSSILVAATGVATVSADVSSAGRYSIYGRGGIALGTVGAATAQSAAGDILLEASIGAAPAPASVTLADGMVLTANSDGIEAARPGGFVADPLVIRLGNGSVVAGGATLRVLRTANAALGDQGTVQIQPVVANGVASIAIRTLDSASADLRAVGDVTVASATVDAGLTLASSAGAVALPTLTIGTAVPLMTAAQVGAIDVKLSGATGAALGTVTAGTNLARDITVAASGGDATITTASARDDIVIASTTGRAIAGDLTFGGAASDSEAGIATAAATDAYGAPLGDPYGFTGSTITGLAGRNIVVSGATAASLGSVTTAAGDGLGDVRVLTAAGPATLTTVNIGGAGLPARVIVATRNGVATGTTLNASGDIIVDATTGSAVLTSGNAGRDGIVVAPTVAIGTLTAGDDIVAVATGGTLTAGTLTATGTNSGDAITTVFRADGSSIVDPVAGGIVGNLAGGNVIALATGDVTVTTAVATAAPGVTSPGLVRLGSAGGSVTTTTATASAGDIVIDAFAINAMTLAAGRDVTLDTLGAPPSGPAGNGMITASRVTAGRDLTINARSADFTGGSGLLAAGRNLNVFAAGPLAIATARAGGTLMVTADTLTATDLESGDALTVLTRVGDATIGTAAAAGHGLLADFSGFDSASTAPGATRNVSITAQGAANVTAASAVGDVALTGATVTATTVSAGRDATVAATGVATLPQLTAGRDVTITAASATLSAGTGLVAAQRNLVATTSGALTIGTARAGEALTATGGSVLATTLASGDALTVSATSGDATVGTATSTGLPLLADFSGFAASGNALGATRDLAITASGTATLMTGVAAHGISVVGATANVTTATANTGGTDGDLAVSGTSSGASLGSGAARDVIVTAAGGDLTVGSATASRDVVLSAPLGTATLTTAQAGRDIRVGGGDVAVTTATADAAGAGGDLVIAATASQSGLDDFHFGGVTLGSGTARDITITATGEVAVQSASASRDLAITSPAITLTTGTAGNNLTLTAYPGCCNVGGTLYGTIDAGSATANAAGGTGSLSIAGNTTLGSGSGYDVVAVGGSLALDHVVALHDVSLAGTSSATVTTATAGHSITVTADAMAAVTTATANTGGTDGDLLVSSTRDTTVGTASARDVRVSGSSVNATTLTATRDLYLDSFDTAVPTASTVRVATGNAGRNAVVVAPAVAIGTLTAGSDVVAVATGGSLTAASLTSTGTSSTDGRTAITRSDGSQVADPTVAGSPAVGTLAGGNVVALASGDLTVGTATATAAPSAMVPGLVRLAALGMTTLTTATASAGDIVATGSAIDGGTLAAGRDITVTATGGDADLGSVASGRMFGLNAANDIVVSGAATATGDASLNAGRDIALGEAAAGDALDAGGSATLTAGRNIVVARPAAVGVALNAASGGAASFAAMTAETATVVSQDDLTLSGDLTTTGALALTSAGGAIAAPDLSGNGITLAAARALTVTGTTASAAGLTATADNLAFGTLSTTGAASLHTGGLLAVTGATTIGGALTATSDAGAIQMGGVTTGGPATLTAAGGAIALANLGTTGAATLLAGQSVAVSGLTRTSGALTATSTNAGLSFGAIGSGAAATLRARTALAVTGLAQATGTLDALSSAGAVGLGSAQAATVTLRGATGVTIAGGTTAVGPVTITADAGPVTTGDLAAGAATSVTATGGAVTLASVSRTAGLTVMAATDAAVTGDVGSSGDVAVTATGGSTTLGSVSHAGKLTLTAANNATIGGPVMTSGDTLITATNGNATVGGAVQTANFTVKADNGTIALGSVATATQASSALTTLDSAHLMLGSGVALVAAQRIQLDVTGSAAGVSLGDGTGAAAGSTKYALSKADLRKLQSPVVEISAAALPVDFGEVDLDGVTPVAGGFAGITSAFGIRTTGNIRLADRLTFTSAAGAAAPRVLTLGGAAGGVDLDKTTATANAIEVLAVPSLDNSTTGTGGQIDAAGSTVQLRATYVALGETPSPLAGRPFIDALLPSGGAALTAAETRTQYVDNASSTLYVAIPPYAKQAPAPQALIQAGTLVLAPGQWALIQNTGPTTTPGGGIIATTLKFNKVAGAAAADPEIAVFGSIAGKTGIASAISIDAGNLDGISPNNIRVNGCVALSTAGCIQSAVSIPLINLADPGRSLLISSSPDLALSVELITGATNEALWREDDDTPGQNRPQRESRP